MNFEFEILKKNRKLILSVIDDFSVKQLNTIPEGFTNNIAWNVAHLITTQQLLCYKLSDLPMLVSDEFVELYRKGTSPNLDISLAEFEEIKDMFLHLPMQLEKDYTAEIFKTYQEYTTSVGITLKNIHAAIAFNNLHEGIHLGIILGLKKLI